MSLATRRKPEAPTDDPVIEVIREAARANVERFSLRRVASDIGMSHTGLRDFIAEVNPRTPYGSVRERLYRWAMLAGIALPDSTPARVSEPSREYARPPRVPPAAYQLVYDHCRTLHSAGVPEEMIEEARRLMSGETFNTLHAQMADERDERGWIADVQAAWAFVEQTLRAQGFDL